MKIIKFIAGKFLFITFSFQLIGTKLNLYGLKDMSSLQKKEIILIKLHNPGCATLLSRILFAAEQ